MIVAGSASPLLLSSAGGYNLTNSLRFRSSASAYLNRTPASAGNRRTYTWSGWVKRGTLTVPGQTLFDAYSGVNDRTHLQFDNFQLRFFNNVSGSAITELRSTQVFRDPSAWYHFVLAVDTTQATASNRAKLYVNGSQITALATATYQNQNTDTYINATNVHDIGRGGAYADEYFDGYLAEINFIDGQALTPSSFGQTSATTGVWIPKKYTGTYGTNGFYLPFTDNSALTTSSNVGLGKDFSGNANYWTTNNISITAGTTYDSMTDVPTLTSATASNYCVLNPLNPSGGTYSDGNLKWVSATTDGRFALSTFDITSSGKWYCEVTIGAKSGTYWTVGAFGSPITFNPRMQYRSDGATQVNSTAGSTWASFTTGDVIGMAFDASTNQITFYKNNTSQGTLTATTTGVSYYFGCGSDSSGSTSTYEINFGQRPFSYTPPTGFVALNTFNLPTPTIGATASTTANKYFDTTLYTGTGATQTITNSGSMQPDFVWTKSRSNVVNHILVDAVRGGNNILFSDLTIAEQTASFIDSFNSNGWTVNSGAGTGGNQSGYTYVGWQWRASNATAVTNTAGSITSTVSANTTAGFSVVTYTGNGTNASTVGHGLGVAPRMVIVKERGNANVWGVGSSSLTSWAYHLRLNSTNAESNADNFWNSTAPTSSVFTLGDVTAVNRSSGTYVAYCFAQVAGYSAFGSYTGNGSSDGTFVYTGFRPRFIMFKVTTTTNIWVIHDTARDTYNVSGSTLIPNASDSEYSSNQNMDILSNGFKLRSSDSATNQSGQTFIYAAFAENPFKYSNAR